MKLCNKKITNSVSYNVHRIFLKYLILPQFLFFSLFSCKNKDRTLNPSAEYIYTTPEQTDDGWETASLSDVGMDAGRITALVKVIYYNLYQEVHAIVIVKDGKLVFEEYFPGHDFDYYGNNFHGEYIEFNRSSLHNTHSATKSIVSALVGIAIDRGFIPSVEDKIFTYFDAYSDLNDEEKDKITVEHLLTMTSGLEWNEWDVSISTLEHDIVRFNLSSDPVRYILSKPVVTEPGTSFYYNGGGVDLLGEIIRIASGIPVNGFSGQHLFGPMDFEQYAWQRLPSGLVCAHGDIYLRPRDMAKFGALFLNNGVWKGTRLISEDWVQKSIEEYISLPWISWTDGYGYLWWLKTYHSEDEEFESFFAEGWGGQKIVVFPGLDMVVVFTGANYMSTPPCDEILTLHILPAVQ